MPVMVLWKDVHGGITCNHNGVIMLWVKKQSMFEEPTERWREGVVARMLFYSSFIVISNFWNNRITMVVLLRGCNSKMLSEPRQIWCSSFVCMI